MPELQFRLEVFEGPLDLLLSLISKNKVDISDIPIALILDQYMEYIEQMRVMDAEVSGEFIVMAAELMLIKSKMLLPKPEKEPEEDPRAKLAQALIEYKRAKENAALLKERYGVFAGRLVKDTEVIDTSKDVPTDLDLELLQKAFGRVLRRNRDLPRLARESEAAIRDLLKTKVVPVPEKIWSIMRMLYREGPLTLENVMVRSRSRSELIASFLALLELMRTGRVKVEEIYTEEGEEDVLLTLNLEKISKPKENEYDGTDAE